MFNFLRRLMQPPVVVPANFQPYYNADLNFDIVTPEEEQLLQEVSRWQYDEVVAAINHMHLARTLQYPEIRERIHSVKIRALVLRVNQMQTAGLFQPAPTFGDYAVGWMAGSVLADEYLNRFWRS